MSRTGALVAALLLPACIGTRMLSFSERLPRPRRAPAGALPWTIGDLRADVDTDWGGAPADWLEDRRQMETRLRSVLEAQPGFGPRVEGRAQAAAVVEIDATYRERVTENAWALPRSVASFVLVVGGLVGGILLWDEQVALAVASPIAGLLAGTAVSALFPAEHYECAFDAYYALTDPLARPLARGRVRVSWSDDLDGLGQGRQWEARAFRAWRSVERRLVDRLHADFARLWPAPAAAAPRSSEPAGARPAPDRRPPSPNVSESREFGVR